MLSTYEKYYRIINWSDIERYYFADVVVLENFRNIHF